MIISIYAGFKDMLLLFASIIFFQKLLDIKRSVIPSMSMSMSSQ